MCVCVYMCVCLWNEFLFVFLFHLSLHFLHSESIPEFSTTPYFFLLYTDTSFTPTIRRLLHVYPTCHHPHFSPIVPSDRQPSRSLASVSLFSGHLIPATELSVPSMPRPLDPFSGGCTPPCSWFLGGEGCWISLLLVKYSPL